MECGKTFSFYSTRIIIVLKLMCNKILKTKYDTFYKSVIPY